MPRWRRGRAVALALALLLAPLAVKAAPTPAPAPATATWLIDADRSFARFSLRVAWLRRLEGAFGRIDGTIDRSPNGRLNTIDVRIPVAELSMADPDHARWARSKEFFDAERHPWITFHADRVPTGLLRDGGALDGELVVRGVRRPQQLWLEPSRCSRPGIDCPLRARAELRRSEFGMTARRLYVGDRVRLRFSILLDPASG